MCVVCMTTETVQVCHLQYFVLTAELAHIPCVPADFYAGHVWMQTIAAWAFRNAPTNSVMNRATN